jgi:hypothetical protein
MVDADANPNLLFGLMALQNGMNDQDQLVAAFRAWSRDAGRSIAEQLAGRAAGSSGSDYRGPAMFGAWQPQPEFVSP